MQYMYTFQLGQTTWVLWCAPSTAATAAIAAQAVTQAGVSMVNSKNRIFLAFQLMVS